MGGCENIMMDLSVKKLFYLLVIVNLLLPVVYVFSSSSYTYEYHQADVDVNYVISDSDYYTNLNQLFIASPSSGEIVIIRFQNITLSDHDGIVEWGIKYHSNSNYDDEAEYTMIQLGHYLFSYGSEPTLDEDYITSVELGNPSYVGGDLMTASSSGWYSAKLGDNINMVEGVAYTVEVMFKVPIPTEYIVIDSVESGYEPELYLKYVDYTEDLYDYYEEYRGYDIYYELVIDSEYVDFNDGWVEVDAWSVIDYNSSHVTFTDFWESYHSEYFYKDYTTIQNFSIQYELILDAFPYSNFYFPPYAPMFSTDIDDYIGLRDNSSRAFLMSGIYHGHPENVSIGCFMVAVHGITEQYLDHDSTHPFDAGTRYYANFTKSGMDVTFNVYTDEAMTSLVSAQNGTLTDDDDYRYLMMVNTAHGGTEWIYGSYGNLKGNIDGVDLGVSHYVYYVYIRDIELASFTSLADARAYIDSLYRSPWWAVHFYDLIAFFSLIGMFANIPIMVYYVKDFRLQFFFIHLICEIVMISMVIGWVRM